MMTDQEIMSQENSNSDYELTDRQIMRRIDHTQLKPFASWSDIEKLCDEAIKYKTASVCIPPVYVKRVHDAYGDKVNICTVIGFPLGYSTTAAKVAEVEQAFADGCNEIDMVVNISDVKNGDYVKVEEEIRILKRVCGEHILKVIIETCFLSEEEKVAMCKAVNWFWDGRCDDRGHSSVQAIHWSKCKDKSCGRCKDQEGFGIVYRGRL